MMRTFSLQNVLTVWTVVGLFAIAHCQVVPLGDWVPGRATHYNYQSFGGNGACGFREHGFATGFAPSSAFYASSATCGECYELTGPRGNFTYTVIDLCPTLGNANFCSNDMAHFDIVEDSFPNIAVLSWGVTLMSWRKVVCPVSAPIQLITGGVNENYIQAYFYRIKVGVKSARVKDAEQQAFTELKRGPVNDWPWSAGKSIVYPVTYQITSIYDETVDLVVNTAPGKDSIVDGTKQFTKWTAVSGNDVIPSFFVYEIYEIYKNTLNNASTKATAEHWVSRNAEADWKYTGSTPSNATYAAKLTLGNYQEWWFSLRGPDLSIPAHTISAVQLQIASTAELTNIEVGVNNYGDSTPFRIPKISSTWQTIYIPFSSFVPVEDVRRVYIKNTKNANVDIILANFALIPAPGVKVPSSSETSPVAPAGTPSNTASHPFYNLWLICTSSIVVLLAFLSY